MTTRYDIVSPRRGANDKTFWKNVGTMFPAREGEGFSIKLDALPLPDDKGEVWIRAFPAKPADGGGKPAPVSKRQQPGGAARSHAPQSDSLDDDIPF